MPESPGRAREDEAVRRFIERFALNLTEAGMARMPARVFATVLVAEDGRRTAAELADQLGVSPAAISGAVRYLTQLRLVSRGREPGSPATPGTRRSPGATRWWRAGWWTWRTASRPSGPTRRRAPGWRRPASSSRTSWTRSRGCWTGGGRGAARRVDAVGEVPSRL